MSTADRRSALESIVKRVTMGPGPITFNSMRVSLRLSSDDSMEIIIETTVPDRDTGRPTKVWSVLPLQAGWTEEEVLWELESSLRERYIHEFYEAFHVDGVRVRDPHRSEEQR